MESRIAVFDAMGTLFDLSALDPLFEELGTSAATRRAWFGRLLHAAAALTLIGRFEPFDELALATLRSTLAQEDLDSGEAERIVEALPTLPPYPDAEQALDRLGSAGVGAVILTNGAKAQTRELLERAGLDGRFSAVFSTEEVEAYKPDARPYRLVSERLGVAPERLTLIAAHAWDVLGARAAGLDAVWVDRLEHVWPFPDGELEQRAPDLAAAACRF